MRPIDEFRGKHFFLSNFYLSPVVFEGVTYPCVENAFQAAKTLDINRRRAFIKLEPGEAKRLGRRVNLRADWENVKLEIMMQLIDEKFRDQDLAERLIATKGASLVEGNRWNDTFWGVDARSGRGQNHLGRILMAVRDEVQKVRSTSRQG